MEQMILPTWPAPKGVKAFTTTRQGGVSQPPFASFNLGAHVGDDVDHVVHNRQQLQKLLGVEGDIQWLNQVHSCEVAVLPSASLKPADASYTSSSHIVCAVLTADCLPVIFTNEAGTEVAAAHAGWRGLCDGVLEATLAKFSDPTKVMAWLGPAIGPEQFEVGAEVRAAFMAVDSAAEQAFVPAGVPDKWFGDLYQLARQRLMVAGCQHIYGGDHCTHRDEARFFSYRRDQQTGRMATVIWIDK